VVRGLIVGYNNMSNSQPYPGICNESVNSNFISSITVLLKNNIFYNIPFGTPGDIPSQGEASSNLSYTFTNPIDFQFLSDCCEIYDIPFPIGPVTIPGAITGSGSDSDGGAFSIVGDMDLIISVNLYSNMGERFFQFIINVQPVNIVITGSSFADGPNILAGGLNLDCGGGCTVGGTCICISNLPLSTLKGTHTFSTSYPFVGSPPFGQAGWNGSIIFS
jgi:hypothetical protein